METQERAAGQSLVEFALCLSLLIVILLGVLDLGRAFHSYIVITNAAREGAYYGSMHPLETNAIVHRVLSEAQDSGVRLTASDVTISSSGLSGTPIRVTVRYNFSLLSAFLLGRQVLQLQSNAQMVIF